MFKGGLLKWLIGDFIFDSLFNPVVAIISKAVKPLWESLSGKTLPSIDEKMAEKAAEQFFSLLGESEYDEKIILKAMNTIADKNIVRSFHRKMLLLKKWFAPTDPTHADRLAEYFRRLISEKTPEETAKLIQDIAEMSDDEWREYLLSTGIDHKDLRTKAEIGKDYYDEFSTAAKKKWRRLRRNVVRYWNTTLVPAWEGLRRRARYLIIGFVAIAGFLLVLTMSAYAFRFMAAFALLSIVIVFFISFSTSAYKSLMSFIIISLASLGLFPTRYVRSLIDLVSRQSFLRYSRAVEIVFLHLATAALVYPSVLYYSAFWIYAAVGAMACMVYIKARDAKTSWLVPGLGIHYFIFLALLFFPQPVHTAQVEFNNLKKKFTLFSNDRSIATMTIFEVTEKTSGWQVADRDEFGKPMKAENGLYRMAPCLITGENDTKVQMEFVPGKKYQISEDGETLDAGEVMVKARAQNADGSWMITDKTVECYLPYSKVVIPKQESKSLDGVTTAKHVEDNSANSNSNLVQKTKVETPKSEDKPKSSTTSFTVPANAVYASGIEVKKGQEIVVTASGKVNSMPEAKDYDGTYKWVGPEGWGTLSPGFISEGKKSLAGPLPQGRSYMALTARVATSQPSLTDGNWTIIGRGMKFKADQDGYLYFVVNEKVQENGSVRMDYLTNNQGGFKVEVKVQ